MKKIIAFSLSLVLFFCLAKGQTPLTVAKDFKVVDVTGVVHSLFNYLENGKLALIMFTSVGCGSCSATYPIVQSNFEAFGCNFGNVVFFKVSRTHTHEDFSGPPFNSFGSYKIARNYGVSIFESYQVFTNPTLVIIKPDASIAEQDIWPVSHQILQDKILEHGGILLQCPVVQTFEIAVEVNPPNAGTIRGVGFHVPGNQVELEALPNQGWVIDNWTDASGQIISTSPYHNFIVPAENVSFKANFKSSTSSGLVHINNHRLSVFPNPTKNLISISAEGVIGIDERATYQIFDVNGRVVLMGQIAGVQTQIDVSGLERGVYFISVENFHQKAKFVKE